MHLKAGSGTVRTVIGGIIHEIWLGFSIGSILLSTLTQVTNLPPPDTDTGREQGRQTEDENGDGRRVWGVGTADDYGNVGRVRRRWTQKEDRTGDEGGRRLRVLETYHRGVEHD